jgi:hypothetical protein
MYRRSEEGIFAEAWDKKTQRHSDTDRERFTRRRRRSLHKVSCFLARPTTCAIKELIQQAHLLYYSSLSPLQGHPIFIEIHQEEAKIDQAKVGRFFCLDQEPQSVQGASRENRGRP